MLKWHSPRNNHIDNTKGNVGEKTFPFQSSMYNTYFSLLLLIFISLLTPNVCFFPPTTYLGTSWVSYNLSNFETIYCECQVPQVVGLSIPIKTQIQVQAHHISVTVLLVWELGALITLPPVQPLLGWLKELKKHFAYCYSFITKNMSREATWKSCIAYDKICNFPYF